MKKPKSSELGGTHPTPLPRLQVLATISLPKHDLSDEERFWFVNWLRALSNTVGKGPIEPTYTARYLK
jgi:hypothetical protein